MAASFSLPTVLANLAAGNQSLTLIDGDFTACYNPLVSLNTFSNYYTDVGTANAYQVTVSSPQTVSQAAGLAIQFLAANANTGASTFQINALASKSIVNPDGSALTPGQIPAAALVSVMYDGTSYQLQSVNGGSKSLSAIARGGRLSLTTAVPVTTSDVTGATTVYFTPYSANFTELSQTTADNTKSPAAVANNSNYDVFLWIDAGTLRATRGPLWTSDTSRGTGAGTTELQFVAGNWTNKVAITNGPGANAGVYVGTIRSDGSAQINDAVAKRGVWNNYNRVLRPMRAVEGTATWNYTVATYRQANAAAANQLDYVQGISEDPIEATVLVTASSDQAINTVRASVNIGVDSTTVGSATLMTDGLTPSANANMHLRAEYQGFPGVGRHTLVWLERSTAAGTTTWKGTDSDSAGVQSGIFGYIRG